MKQDTFVLAATEKQSLVCVFVYNVVSPAVSIFVWTYL